MKVDIIKLPKSEIELKIEVPVQEWQEFFDEAAKELAREIKIDGFRPGNAPAKLVEERIGSAKILEHAAEYCVKKCYIRAIMENNIEAIGRPEISVTKVAKDNPFEFKAKVAVMPEIQLPDYKKIAQSMQKEKKDIKVIEEEIEKSVDWLAKSRTKYITVNRGAGEGDKVEIDFEGSCDGEKLQELVSKNHPAILGKGYLIPGFEQNIIGMKEGEEKEFDLLFSQDAPQKHLAGKIIKFKTRINLVQEAELPEINDSFAQSLGDFKDLSTLRQGIRDGLQTEKQNQEKDRWRTELVKKISQEVEMEIPEVLIEGELQTILNETKAKVAEMGLDFNQFLERLKKTEADLLKEYQPQAEERVRVFLILKEIAKKEEIEVQEKEIEEETNKILRHFENISQAKNNIDINQLKGYTESALKNEKVFQLLENC